MASLRADGVFATGADFETKFLNLLIAPQHNAVELAQQLATTGQNPTVKQLAERPGGDAYADALRELFDLDPAATAAVVSVALPTEGGPR